MSVCVYDYVTARANEIQTEGEQQSDSRRKREGEREGEGKGGREKGSLGGRKRGHLEWVLCSRQQSAMGNVFIIKI